MVFCKHCGSGGGNFLRGVKVLLALVVVGALVYWCFGREDKQDPTALAYAAFAADLQDTEDRQSWEELRFALRYVDGDDVPELLLACGDSHADGMEIYSCTGQDYEVVPWGTFGEFGAVAYYPGTGVVANRYGGMGFFEGIYEQGGPNGIERVLAIETQDLSREQARFFWQSPCDVKSWSEAWEDFDLDAIEVTQEEYERRSGEFLATLGAEDRVEYCSMQVFTPKALLAAYEQLTSGETHQ